MSNIFENQFPNYTHLYDCTRVLLQNTTSMRRQSFSVCIQKTEKQKKNASLSLHREEEYRFSVYYYY